MRKRSGNGDDNSLYDDVDDDGDDNSFYDDGDDNIQIDNGEDNMHFDAGGDNLEGSQRYGGYSYYEPYKSIYPYYFKYLHKS